MMMRLMDATDHDFLVWNGLEIDRHLAEQDRLAEQMDEDEVTEEMDYFETLCEYTDEMALLGLLPSDREV